MDTLSNLDTILGGEKSEFVVKAARRYKRSSSFTTLGVAIFWLGLISFFIIATAVPILQGGEAHFTVNGVATTAGPGNWRPLLIPGLMIGLFFLIGIGILCGGLYMLFAPGGWFIGTSQRFIEYRKGEVRSIDWEQFSGNVTLSMSGQESTLVLQLRTGHVVSQKHGPSRYVPDDITLAGIPNGVEVERICRTHIKQNDPTPPSNN